MHMSKPNNLEVIAYFISDPARLAFFIVFAIVFLLYSNRIDPTRIFVSLISGAVAWVLVSYFQQRT
jgi:hypothetical protein